MGRREGEREKREREKDIERERLGILAWHGVCCEGGEGGQREREREREVTTEWLLCENFSPEPLFVTPRLFPPPPLCSGRVTSKCYWVGLGLAQGLLLLLGCCGCDTHL